MELSPDSQTLIFSDEEVQQCGFLANEMPVSAAGLLVNRLVEMDEREMHLAAEYNRRMYGGAPVPYNGVSSIPVGITIRQRVLEQLLNLNTSTDMKQQMEQSSQKLSWWRIIRRRQED